MIAVVLESALRSLLLGGAVWVALKAFRVADARSRKLAWIVVLLGSLVMPGLMQWTTLPVEAQPTIVTHSISALAAAAPVSHLPVQVPGWNWKQAAMAVYLAGTAVLLLRLGIGLAMAWRLWRRAQPFPAASEAHVAVRVSDGTATPVTIGSGVLLPLSSVDWDAERLRIVLAHERSHVRQKDFYWQALAGFHSCLFWFSPMAWWLQQELIEAGETVSDDAALREAGSAASYAELLLEFAAGPRGFAAGVAMARSDMRRRVHHILNSCSPFEEFTWKRAAMLAATLIPLLLAAAGISVHLRAQTSNQTSAKHHNDSFVIVSGDSITMNGSSGDEEMARAQRDRIAGDYVWFVRGGKAYVVADPAWVKQAKDLFKPQEELGEKEEELGREQEKLGEQQSRIGEQQEKVSVKLPAIDKQLEALQEKLKAMTGDVTQDKLGELQEKIAELESKLGAAQEIAGEKQSALGEQQAKLGEEQAKLGEKQAELGEQQAKIAEEATRKIGSMIDQALGNGKAHLAR